MSIGAMPTYEAYRDSGTQWLSKIPSHWKVTRSKFVFTQRTERARKDDIQLSATQAYGVIPQEEYEEKIGRKVTKIQFHLDKRKHVELDDFVISMRSFQGGLERAYATGCIRSSYVVLRPLITSNPGYYTYLFKSQRYIEALQTTASFIRDGQDLNFENFSKVDLLVPSYQEQTAIANFLNKKTAQIDAAIAIKEQQITLLKERKQIMIQQAVTQGLNPDVAMKDSGVEWIGEIPEHWETMTLRYAFNFRNNQRLPLSAVEREGKQGIYPYYGASGIIDYIDDYIFDEKLILIAEDGANLLSKSTPLAFVASGKYWVNNHAHIIQPKYPGFKYWSELLSSLDYTTFISGAAQPKLTRDRLSDVTLPIPPNKEITQIIQFIDSVTPKIDESISLNRKQIQKLKEYKTTLINSAVTGKIKVPEAR